MFIFCFTQNDCDDDDDDDIDDDSLSDWNLSKRYILYLGRKYNPATIYNINYIKTLLKHARCWFNGKRQALCSAERKHLTPESKAKVCLFPLMD